MSQQGEPRPDRVGVFLNPGGAAGAAFAHACAGLFAQLDLADSAQQAAQLLARRKVDLLVLDLDRFEPGLDLAALGALVAQRGGAAVLVLCPFASARWLPALMAFGPLDYAIAPLSASGLRAAALRPLAQAPVTEAPAGQLRELLALRTRAQQALAEADDLARLAPRLCEALCGWPGVVHAALLHRMDGGGLRLEGQHGEGTLDLARLLPRGEPLPLSPGRQAFPALLAAASGELVLLDALEKAGEPELAQALRSHGVEMAIGVPIRGDGPGAPRGALSLLFGRAQRFSHEQLAALGDLAQLAGIGLRMAGMSREAEQMLARLTHIATTDALTGAANRRHGEELLEQEIRRARRYRVALALIAFDIDRFKAINDNYGHPVGDVALRTVADAARAVLRGSDALVRAGGEEFQVIAPHTSAIEALKMAEKLRLAIEQTPVPGCDRVTISLGVAQLGEHESGDSLAQRVNAALARAKRAGRNCVELAMQ
jgi:diguanylate cyclase (GGDEF)-like protein